MGRLTIDLIGNTSQTSSISKKDFDDLRRKITEDKKSGWINFNNASVRIKYITCFSYSEE